MITLEDVRRNPGSSDANRMHPTADLGHFEPHGLARAVEAAVRQIDETTLKPVAQRGAGVVFQPQVLLALLTFWYARQVYGSADIAAKLRQDVARRHFSCENLPGAHMLRHFRSDNRGALHACLTSVLHLLAQEKMLQGLVTRVSETHLADEANRRIVMAMFTDSLELDEESVTHEQAEPSFIVANE